MRWHRGGPALLEDEVRLATHTLKETLEPPIRLLMIDGVGFEVVWLQHKSGVAWREMFRKRAEAYAFYDDKLRELSAQVAKAAPSASYVPSPPAGAYP